MPQLYPPMIGPHAACRVNGFTFVAANILVENLGFTNPVKNNTGDWTLDLVVPVDLTSEAYPKLGLIVDAFTGVLLRPSLILAPIQSGGKTIQVRVRANDTPLGTDADCNWYLFIQKFQP